MRFRHLAFGGAAVGLAAAGFIAATTVGAGDASAHRSGCHALHSCPSDDHTYRWLDPSTGLGWDCAKAGAPELDPVRDTTVIISDAYTYDCRAAAVATAPPTTATETITYSTSTTTTTGGPEVVLPNASITPGAFNAAVRQATIRKTICVRGWTKTVRPPVAYTNTLKRRQMSLYGETGLPSGYEEDHLIPLELGGAPRNPRNLWPEPRSESRVSDPLETKLKRGVCRGALTLARARTTIHTFKATHG